MKRAIRTLAVAGIVVLFLYAAIFPLLTIDTLSKIFSRASTYPTRAFFLLLYLELTRLLTSAIAIIIALALCTRGGKRDARALALFLLFAVICYEKVFGSNSYPGPVQESITQSLLQRGASPQLLLWLFGPLPWALWPALAALLRFSVLMPRELDAAALVASGSADRRGFLRGSGVAGADIGAFFRGLSLQLTRAGGYRPRALALAAAILIIAQTFLHNIAFTAVLYILALSVLAIAVTNIRAGRSIAEGADRARMTWISEGFIIALFLFLVSAAVLAVVRTSVALMAAFILVMLTPAAVIICLALSVLDHGELDTQEILDRTVRHGTVALAMALTFGVLLSGSQLAAERFGMSYALAVAVAAAASGVLFLPVSRAADAIRLRILEKPQR